MPDPCARVARDYVRSSGGAFVPLSRRGWRRSARFQFRIPAKPAFYSIVDRVAILDEDLVYSRFVAHRPDAVLTEIELDSRIGIDRYLLLLPGQD